MSDPLFGASAHNFADPQPAADDGAAEPASSSGYQKRIDQFRAKLGDADRRNTELERKVAALEGRMSVQPQAPANQPQDFKDHRDLSSVEWAQLLQESGSDPATLARAMDSISERKARKVVEEFSGKQAQHTASQQQVQSMLAYLSQVYGQDFSDPQSPVRKRAEAVSQTLASQYGADRFSNDPVSVLAAYAEGGRQVYSERLETMKTELEQLKDRVKRAEAMNRTADAAAELNEESRKALTEKDPRKALRNLNITRALSGL